MYQLEIVSSEHLGAATTRPWRGVRSLRVSGRNLRISFWCWNEGPREAGPFSVRLFLSKDLRFGTGDQIVSVKKMAGLASKSVSPVMKVRFKASKRFRNLVLHADSREVVTEIDETNNVDWNEILWRSQSQ